MKERVTLTIDEDLLRRIDGRVDGNAVKNRSHAIELLLRKAFRGTTPTTAAILAGGKGGRGTPEALADVKGAPMIQHNIDLCVRFGIRDIILIAGPLNERLRSIYGDGEHHNVRITYLDEKEPLGTAGCLRLLRERVKETLIVLNGDELKDVNLQRLYEAHLESGARATIALTTVEDPSSYGAALLDGSRILRFVEKPRKEDAPSKLINAGLYLLEPDVLDLIPAGFATLEQDVFPKLAKAGTLQGYPFAGQWFDMDALERARKEWRGFHA